MPFLMVMGGINHETKSRIIRATMMLSLQMQMQMQMQGSRYLA